MTQPSQASIRDSYEEIKYIAGPHYTTHPLRQATVASLMGLEPPDPQRCRVLEIGCATGGNLLPMALVAPESEFVGFDLSPSQIEMGQETIAAVGLTNIRLETLDILDVGDPVERWGVFDYIICHGVYSWVPAEVQAQILQICRKGLSPNGVAYISYNTYPGSQTRDLARGVALFGARHVLEEGRNVPQVLAFWEAVSEAMPGDEHVVKQQLKKALEVVSSKKEYYVAHEYLEDVNEPLWFYDFADTAAAAGLQYLGDAMGGSEVGELPEETQAAFGKLAPSLVAQQQLVDLATNSSFRRTLLCHQEVQVPRSPRPGVVAGMHAMATAQRIGEDGQGRVTFRSRTSREFTTNVPLLVVALDTLYEAWPASLSVRQLFEQASRADMVRNSPEAPCDFPFLASVLLQLWLKSAVELRPAPAPLSPKVGDRPSVSRLARVQAARGTPLTNLLHQQVVLPPEELQMVPYVDGTRDFAALQAVLRELQPDRGEGETEWLTEFLDRLASAAFLSVPAE